MDRCSPRKVQVVLMKLKCLLILLEVEICVTELAIYS